jgi:hypothetical protein
MKIKKENWGRQDRIRNEEMTGQDRIMDTDPLHKIRVLFLIKLK